MKGLYKKAEILNVEKIRVNEICAQCDVDIRKAIFQWADFWDGGGESDFQYTTFTEAYYDHLFLDYPNNTQYDVNYWNTSPDGTQVYTDQRDKLTGAIVRVYRFTNYEGYYMVYEDYAPYIDEGDSAVFLNEVGFTLPPGARGDNWQEVRPASGGSQGGGTSYDPGNLVNS